MHPTLASLVRHSALGLRVLACEDKLDAGVQWAHASELADPVPYLDGGELLLTTGLELPVGDAAAMLGYTSRLAAAGVVGLGFGVGVHHEQVPPALLGAARETGLPLLEVPQHVPFIAISKAVSADLATERYRAVTAGFAAQRELTRAALSPGGRQAVVERLAAQTDGWAALYDVTGAVGAAAPAWAARRAGKLAGEVRRLAERPAPATAVCPAPDLPGERVELQSVGTGPLPQAVLALGTDAPLGAIERHALESALALLTLMTERSRAFQAAEARLGAAVLRMLLSGEPDHARAVAGQLYGELLDAPLRVLLADPGDDPGELESLGTAVESAAARAGESVLAAADGERLVLLTADGGAALAACLAHARQTSASVVPAPRGERHGLALGVSAPAGTATADTAYKQAQEALAVARRRRRPLVEHDEVAAGSVLDLLADDAVRAFADGMLRALREHDAHGRGDLMASLRAWLARHGQWDAAAADLGVHRHTLRYRMRRVEEILGRSLEDPDVRMELWLALKTAAV